MRALRKPVLEFYSHRDFHVIEMRRGYKIQHSSITRERNGKTMKAGEQCSERSQRNLMVAICLRCHPESKGILESRQSGAHSRRSRSARASSRIGYACSKGPSQGGPEKVPEEGRWSLIPELFDGKTNTSERVRTWERENPGKVFYD